MDNFGSICLTLGLGDPDVPVTEIKLDKIMPA